ncbi:sugar-binding transcriptional regulator [Mycolicibacterium smegmatis]|uniref:DeoR (Transcriptional regulator) n=3 Tax=Mycolicibacterium smegmatis TaxID=1772 RepID=I7FET9_MYCS2|nr:DNA-binding transcriptional regulator [Mycolicibacterium smegmatis]ABK75137.1 transcriptional regulator [Mycolicibacterium smegmatis MC2 155]AFP39985.1 DeoR (Transcriptional regulator) [Mycolicibacterium smegmatis MC2 155]AIU08741.1 DeoR faimly transcriptional regulator [Mycolicibacterium smegmatis MC2 155]AIU15366.1 DeoR faimly transcriptional regulator [Mycolicibacterium smegmatis]AIU21989.1 DeoR faimly transcriptional regulator [Mycolicibacterium smegmatis]
MGPDELFQRAVIARRYYLEGRTRVQIAEEFGISRFKVARMLDEALGSGMVEIKIHNPGSIDVELSTALQRRYGLQHAYAVMTSPDSDPRGTDTVGADDRVASVAKAMAELLQSILRDGDVIGVDCGRTLAHIADHITELPHCDVVQLTGMAGAITHNGVDLVRRISEVSGGQTWPLYAPLVVSDARTAASLASSQQIQDTIAQHAKVTCAIVSVGAWVEGASQVYSSLTTTEVEALEAAGVCAESCALLLDAEGNRLPGLDDRRMGIDEATLREIPTVIAIATGPEKIAATRAVLRSGMVSSLVTDVEIAAAVLDDNADEEGAKRT